MSDVDDLKDMLIMLLPFLSGFCFGVAMEANRAADYLAAVRRQMERAADPDARAGPLSEESSDTNCRC